MVVVAKLLNPDWKIEIEADALLPESPADRRESTEEASQLSPRLSRQ